MGLKLKNEVNPEILRNFGFRLGREYFGNEKWCGDGCGYEYQADWYHKFLTIDWDTGELGDGFNDIAYIYLKKMSLKKEENYVWLKPEHLYSIDFSEFMRPSELKLKWILLEPFEKKYQRMCWKYPDQVWNILSKVGKPVTESTGWKYFEDYCQYSPSLKIIKENNCIEIYDSRKESK